MKNRKFWWGMAVLLLLVVAYFCCRGHRVDPLQGPTPAEHAPGLRVP